MLQICGVCVYVCVCVCVTQALIAGGTFNGDVYVWDLSQDTDMQRGRSDPLCDIRHQVSVTLSCVHTHILVHQICFYETF